MRALRWIGLAITLAACGDASAVGLDGTSGTGGTGGSTPTTQGFSAQYILASVSPTPFVPGSTAFAQKSVIGQCVDIRSSGTMLQSILYTQDNPAQITRETDSWVYTLSGSDILTVDPLAGAGATTQRIGGTGDAQIAITRVLRNDGLAVVRTLVFSRVSQLSTPCGT